MVDSGKSEFVIESIKRDDGIFKLRHSEHEEHEMPSEIEYVTKPIEIEYIIDEVKEIIEIYGVDESGDLVNESKKHPVCITRFGLTLKTCSHRWQMTDCCLLCAILVRIQKKLNSGNKKCGSNRKVQNCV